MLDKILLVEPIEERRLKLLKQLKQVNFDVKVTVTHEDALILERNHGPFDFYVIADKFPNTLYQWSDKRALMLAQQIHDVRGVPYNRMAVMSDSLDMLYRARNLGIPNTYRKTQIPNPSPIERDRKYLAEDITRILTGGQTTSSTAK